MASHRRAFLLAAVFVAVPALAVSQVPPQQPESPDSPAATVVDQVTVNVVNIDVHVTNRRGEPIADLTAADFEVYEEGEQVEVTNFLSAATRDGLEWTEGDELEELTDAEAPLMVALHVDRYRTTHGNLLRHRR